MKKRASKRTAKTPVWQGARKQRTAASARAERAAPVVQHVTKKAVVLGLLRRDEGATIDELMSQTGWQAHSVRGFISGTLRKALGLTVVREERADGTATYRIVRSTDATAE